MLKNRVSSISQSPDYVYTMWFHWGIFQRAKLASQVAAYLSLQWIISDRGEVHELWNLTPSLSIMTPPLLTVWLWPRFVISLNPCLIFNLKLEDNKSTQHRVNGKMKRDCTYKVLWRVLSKSLISVYQVFNKCCSIIIRCL